MVRAIKACIIKGKLNTFIGYFASDVTLPVNHWLLGTRYANKKGCDTMLYSRSDVELLRLAGRYRWLPYSKLGSLGFNDILAEIEKLQKMGLIYISKTLDCVYLTSAGFDILDATGYPYTPSRKRAYAGALFLRRRLETAYIVLTCTRAGIDCTQDDVSALRKQPVFYPAVPLRPAILNCANCSGFGHWGDSAYMIQYISSESQGMYSKNELDVFHKLQSLFSPIALVSVPSKIIIAGESYTDIYRRLTESPKSAKQGKYGFEDFHSVYRNSILPIHLLPCNDIGVKQLKIMCQTDYREKIAKAAFDEQWMPKDSQIPEADGTLDGRPVVIAADMDIRRIEKVVMEARKLNRSEVLIAALEEQIVSLLYKIFPPKGFTTLLAIRDDILTSAFGELQGYVTDNTPAYDDKGGVVHA